MVEKGQRCLFGTPKNDFKPQFGKRSKANRKCCSYYNAGGKKGYFTKLQANHRANLSHKLVCVMSFKNNLSIKKLAGYRKL